MTRQAGLFDVDERLRRLSDIGDQLEAFAAVVDFEMFRPELVAALRYGDGAKGGRPPFDPVMMFKILVIQAQNNLGDDRAEFLINDRLSFIRFLGLGLTDRVPNAKTIWAFRERLTKAGAIEALFMRFDLAIREQATSRCPARSLMRASSRPPSSATRMPRRKTSRRAGSPRSGKSIRRSSARRTAMRVGRWYSARSASAKTAPGTQTSHPVFGYKSHASIDRLSCDLEN
jgi:transposase, IS5 family